MKNINLPNSKELYLTSDQMYNTFVRRDSLVCNMSLDRVHVNFSVRDYFQVSMCYFVIYFICHKILDKQKT